MIDQFITALQNGNIQALNAIPKADLHNHGILGGNLAYVEQWSDKTIPRLVNKLSSIQEMEQWVGAYYLPLVAGTAGFEKACESALVQAATDGVKVLAMSVDVYHRFLWDGSVTRLVEVLDRLHRQYAPDIEFRPELGLTRSIALDRLMEWFEPFLDCDYFQSLDLYGDEMAQPIQTFKPIYQLAKQKGMVLKAHVGEFGQAFAVREAVEALELDQVQHGIAAAASPEVMDG